MPRVSVIIPAFNVEAFVADAINSALGQTYTDHEVIVVNDGSTDATHEVLQAIDGITYLQQDHRGASAARNHALSKANGELVALLDSDDLWRPDWLAKMVGQIDELPATTVVSSNAVMLRGASESGSYYGSRPKRLRFRSDNQRYWITQYNFVLGFALTRRAAIESVGLYDESLRTFEDWDLWLRLLTQGGTAVLMDEALGTYRLHGANLTSDPLVMISDEVRLLEKANGDPLTSEIRGINGRLAFAQGKLCLTQGSREEAIAHFKEAAADRGLQLELRHRARFAAFAPAIAYRLYVRPETA